MNAKDAVAKRFQNLCKERNMALNELANLSGVTPSTLYSMMDERRRDISILSKNSVTDWKCPLLIFFMMKFSKN